MQIEFNQKIIKADILFSEQQIKQRVKDIAQKINQDFNKQEPLVILIILNGAFIFAADLVRHLDMPTEIETTRLKSYEGVSSTGNIQSLSPLATNLSGKNILIIEDIIETGKTMHFLLKELESKHVKSVKVCTLLNKSDSHETPIKIDYVGFEIAKNFVIGYGLDLDGKYRNLSYIAELSSSGK